MVRPAAVSGSKSWVGSSSSGEGADLPEQPINNVRDSSKSQGAEAFDILTPSAKVRGYIKPGPVLVQAHETRIGTSNRLIRLC